MTHTTKLLSLFLLAGVFAVATVQPASAQSDVLADHDVTLAVDNIDELTVTGAPSITINSGDLNSWVEGDGTGGFTVTSNAESNRKIQVSNVTTTGDASLGNFGLRVKADGVPGAGTEAYTGEFELTAPGASTLNTGKFITGFQKVLGSSHGLIYEANASVDYNPNKTMVISVEYTLTGN